MAASLLNLDELVSATGGFSVSALTECVFASVATDSRLVKEKTMFVPLVGTMQNGHKYVPQAVEKGASVILIDEEEYKANGEYYKSLSEKKISTVVVKNTLTALQKAAGAYVAKFPSLLKICITGSSGKTTTKEMTVALLKKHFGAENVAYTHGNFNSETGLPLSVFNNLHGTEKVGVFEMGMNRENEIGEISEVLKAKYGIITNIGTAHIGILGSRENIAREKRKAFDYIPADGAAFVPFDDDFADFCTEKVKGKIVKFGKSVPESESKVRFIKNLGLDGTVFSYDGVEITLPLAGEYNYQNALGVTALARELNIPAVEVKAAFEGMAAVSGRMENKKITLKNNKKITVIEDCYNANPDSMGKVIDFCSELKAKKVLVLGDMKELGEDSFAAHSEIGKKAQSVNAKLVIFAGPEMKAAYDAAVNKDSSKKNSYSYFENTSEADIKAIAAMLLNILTDEDVLLLKGSHSMALERVIPEITDNNGEGK